MWCLHQRILFILYGIIYSYWESLLYLLFVAVVLRLIFYIIIDHDRELATYGTTT